MGIQITVNIIVNEMQTIAGALLARWMYVVNPECCCLNSNTGGDSGKNSIHRKMYANNLKNPEDSQKKGIDLKLGQM